MASVKSSAVRALQLEMKKLQEEPVEGFGFKLADEANMFQWEVVVFGPPNTLYEGGYFKALMNFPQDYPYSPPSFRFLSPMWHPNIYKNGEVCISILHPPVDDPTSGEPISERWNPTQSIRTVLLSIISLLNEPNTSSPANVDASVSFRRWRDGIDKEYENTIKQQVMASKAEADKDGIIVPTTVEDYCIMASLNAQQCRNSGEFDNFGDDYNYAEYYDDDNDDGVDVDDYYDEQQ